MYFISLMVLLAIQQLSVNCCFSSFFPVKKPETVEYIYTIPSSGPFVGSYSIKIKGPEFRSKDKLTLSYNEKNFVDCKYQDKLTVTCPVPVLDQIGQIPIVLRRNGLQYSGYFHALYGYATRQTYFQRTDYFYNPKTADSTVTWSIPDDIRADGVVINTVSFVTDLFGRVNVYEKVLSQDASNLNSITYNIRSILPDDSYRFNSEDTNVGAIMFHLKSKKDDTLIDWSKDGAFTLNAQQTPAEKCLAATDNEVPFALNEVSIEIPCPSVIQTPSTVNGPWRDIFETFKSDEACNRRNLTRPCRIFPGAAWCYRSVHPTTNGYGQQCCYNSTGNLIMGYPGGAALDITHQSFVEGVYTHFRGDAYYYILCCFLSDHCPKYYVLRPSVAGDWNPYNSAGSFGALNFITFDNLNYTIQSVGDYNMLRIDSIKLLLQAQVGKIRGNAIGMQSITFREGSSGLLKVEVTDSGKVIVTHNSIPLTFTDSDYFYFKSFLIAKTNDTYSIQPRSGILIEVSVNANSKQIGLMASVPVKFKGKVLGMLGSWDDDATNDLVSSSDMFVLNSNSLMSVAINSQCENSLQCLYDFNLTGDIAFAKFGLEMAKKIMAEKNWFSKHYRRN